MKKQFTLISAALLLSATATIGQNVYIPDAAFKSYLVGNNSINTSMDSEIQVSEAAAFTGEINCGYNGSITDLTGIEAFTNLNSLSFDYCSVTSLDISQNQALEYLSCKGNQLTGLNMSNQAGLRRLWCSDNQLTSLTLSPQTASTLDLLEFENNYVTGSLDLTGYTALDILKCTNNQLSGLLIDCPILSQLYCGQNNLTSLDVSACTELYNFYCPQNQLTSLTVGGSDFFATFDCSSNSLTTLDFSSCPNLSRLGCNFNQLTSLNISTCTQLTRLECAVNYLTALDLTNIPLHYLQCQDNQITSLDLSSCDLYEFSCRTNQLTSIDVSAQTYMSVFYCRDNQLTSLDISANHSIYSFNCYGNQLTSLNIANGNNTNFDQYFFANNNPNLTCITVDDANWAATNWTSGNGIIDSWATFSENCALVGIEEQEAGWSVYPNPSNGLFTVNLNTVANCTIEVFDPLGKLVFTETTRASNTTIDLQNHPAGIYTVCVAEGENVVRTKVVKQ